MGHHDGTESGVPALEAESKDGSVRTLEALPALPVTKSMAATATEARLDVSSHHPVPNAPSGLPPTQSLATAAPSSAPLQAKPRNVYLVAAFCSLGGFLFGADTGKYGQQIRIDHPGSDTIFGNRQHRLYNFYASVRSGFSDSQK